MGINWASSLEVALRSVSWIWAWHLAAAEENLAPSARHRIVATVEHHGRHIEKYLSAYFSPNTHLTGEALGLCYNATTWPHLTRSSRWWALGARILCREAALQVRADGMHFERSTCYHLYTLDFLLHYLLLCEARDMAPSKPISTAVSRLAQAAQTLRNPEGRLSNFGDEDGGRLLFLGQAGVLDPAPSLTVAAALVNEPVLWPGSDCGPESVWVLGAERFVKAAGSDVDVPDIPAVWCCVDAAVVRSCQIRFRITSFMTMS